MDEKRALLQKIPQVDLLLRREAVREACESFGHTAVRKAVRQVLDSLRAGLLAGEVREIPSMEALEKQTVEALKKARESGLRRVINATGVALHTNLGRAPLAEKALKALEAAAGYLNLEYDLPSGERGSRGTFVEPLLCALCGSEAALVVNNNAAALLLALSTFSKGKEIVVSRGELVEIGDGFRIPDIMAESGGTLCEVGSTNKTRLSDYENAINEQTGMLLKVHTSNYRVIGFSSSVQVRELAALGAKHNLPVLADLGSGAVLEASEYPFSGEPTVPQTLRDGADLVCFSGDKLLGGPQAGILLGKKDLIARMKRHPLARALRIDKLSLAALEATLRLYENPKRAKEEIPVLASLSAVSESLRRQAQALCREIVESGADCGTRVVPQQRPVGGGAAPGQLLDGFAVAVRPHRCAAEQLEALLRNANPPVIARIFDGELLFDPATISESDFEAVAAALAKSLG